MRVRWSDQAQQRLREIVAYISQDSPEAARKEAVRLLRRSRELAQPPLLGHPMHDYPGENLRELLERPYRLIFRVISDEVEIVTVMHYRQQLPKKAVDLRRV